MNGDPLRLTMMALLMVAAGSMVAMAGAMLRAPRPMVRWVGFIFSLAVASYAVKLWNDQVHVLPPAILFARLAFAVGTVGWYWLFVMALFEDSPRIRGVQFAAIAATNVIGIAGAYAPAPHHAWLWLLTSLIHIGMALHAMTIVVQGWKGDLVEARRRLRGPFLATVTAYILVVRGMEVWEIYGDAPAWYPAFNAASLCIVCLLGCFVFLDTRNELFGPARSPAYARRPVQQGAGNGGQAYAVSGNGGSLDRTAKADLDRLQSLMCAQEIWREEGLTIAGLAARAGIPEAQVRRLISDCLGYRNFPSYVNAHRIAAAKTRLADPSEARISISAIAYDTGFASLGPFNRAFKEVTGVSPSEWRRSSLSEPSPISSEA